MKYESEHIIHLTLELLPLPIIIHDFDHIHYYNCKAKKVLSLTEQGMEGQSFSVYSFLHPHYHQRIRHRQNQFSDMKLGEVYEDELRVITQDETLVDVEVFSTPVTYEGQQMLLTAGRDVTKERKITEEIIKRAEKLNIVGQMAAGIAHEIRNPLTSIKGFIQLLHEKHQEDTVYFQLMLTELDRINLIISDFLVLAKPEILQLMKINLVPILLEVKALLEPQCRMKNVTVRVQVDKPLPMLYGDTNQLKQVFINLVKNGVEATRSGGSVVVEAEPAADGMIQILITDDGEGISDEKLPKIGEPFFTTKETGTGLGLMVSYKIIENHHGVMKLSSEQGKGTKIEILLPTQQKQLLAKEEEKMG